MQRNTACVLICQMRCQDEIVPRDKELDRPYKDLTSARDL